MTARDSTWDGNVVLVYESSCEKMRGVRFCLGLIFFPTQLTLVPELIFLNYFWSNDSPILFLVLVVRECTRYVDNTRGTKECVPNLQVCCVKTYFWIFDVKTVSDSPACLFCI